MTDPIEEVRAAVGRLMEAFSTGDEEGYFACFHPDATFLFHGPLPRRGSDRFPGRVPNPGQDVEG